MRKLTLAWRTHRLDLTPANLLTAAALLLILLAGAYLRRHLYQLLPIIMTNDAWDYLKAAYDLFHRLDFASVGLRDVRLPGYSAFLALIQPLTHMQSNRIILAQSALGLGGATLGAVIGWLLRSRALAVTLAAYLALNPIYWLFEHALMTESLFFFTLLLTLTLAAWALRLLLDHDRLPPLLGLALGVSMGVSLLVRANGMFLSLGLGAGLALAWLRAHPGRPTWPTWRIPTTFFAAIAIGGTLLVGPWLGRNYVLYGKATLANLTYRNLMAYKGLHGTVDLTLPKLHALNQELNERWVNTNWLITLYKAMPANEGEARARAVLQEQLAAHPDWQVNDMIENFACFGGAACRTMAGERVVLRNWLRHQIPLPKLLHQLNKQSMRGANPDFLYLPLRLRDPFVVSWTLASFNFLEQVRPWLYLAFWLALTGYGLAVWRRDDPNRLRRAWLEMIALGYLATVIFHAVTLASFERYALQFDSLLVMGIVLPLTWLGEKLRRRETPDAPAQPEATG